MKTNSSPRCSVALISGLLGLLGLLGPAPVSAQMVDLTVTVEELADGQVRFTISGATTAQQTIGSLFNTNFSSDPPLPPANGTFGSIPMPPGLFLSVPAGDTSEPEGPEEGGTSGTIDLPVDTAHFSEGRWFLMTSSSAFVPDGSEISGFGTIVTDAVPFSYFVPGIHQVDPIIQDSEEAAEPEEGLSLPSPGPFSTTYVVIPYEGGPSIQVSNPGRFPTTRVGRSGGTRKVLVRNTGDVRLTNLSASLAGHTRDFSVSALPAALEPGRSTMLSVRFRPTRKGTRRAILTARGSAIATLASAEEIEENNVEPPREITVSDSVELVGKGVVRKKPKRKPRPKVNTPRFPRFFGQLN